MIIEEVNRNEFFNVPSTTLNKITLAIIGLDAIFGEFDGIQMLSEKLYEGKQTFRKISEERWLGLNLSNKKRPYVSYIDQFKLDVLYHHVPPNEVETMNPAQLLMLKVADQAIKNSGLKRGDRVAVIVGMGFDLSTHRLHSRWCIKNQIYQKNTVNQSIADIAADSLHSEVGVEGFASFIGNILASRIAALWDFTGPAFTLSAEENTIIQGLIIARNMIATDEVDAVILGGIDLAADPEHAYLLENQLHYQQNISLSYDKSMDGVVLGDGAAVIILKNAAHVQNQDVYAYIDGVALEAQSNSLPETIQLAANAALEDAGIISNNIGYLELNASGLTWQDEAEIEGLSKIYKHESDDCHYAIGSIKSQIGHTFAVSGLAAIIHTTLCLSKKYFPISPNWVESKTNEIFSNSNFYVLTQKPHPWIISNGKRYAAISNIGVDGSVGHIIMQENRYAQCLFDENKYFLHDKLMVVSGSSRYEIINKLQQYINYLSLSDILKNNEINVENNKSFKLVLIVHDLKNIHEEMHLALQMLNQNNDPIKSWQTLQGSYYTENPLGNRGKICFVYPGINNCYPYLGSEILNCYKSSSAIINKILLSGLINIPERFLYPRSKNKIDHIELEKIEDILLNNAKIMSTLTTFFSIAYTKIINEEFGIMPYALMGYSSGETNLLISNNIWDISVFNVMPEMSDELLPPFDIIKSYWLLNERDAVEWAVYYLLVNEGNLQENLDQYQHVYLTHINSKNEVVIAGDRHECGRIIKNLNCDAFEASNNLIMHCPPVSLIKEMMLNNLKKPPINNFPYLIILSSGNVSYPISSNEMAEKIFQGLTTAVQFPNQIMNAYHSGCRIFIEMGPGGSCTRWIAENLKLYDHVSLTINKRGYSEEENKLKFLATMISHHVNIKSLIKEEFQKINNENKSLYVEIKIGRAPIQSFLKNKLNHNDIDLSPTIILQEIAMRNHSHSLYLESESRLFYLQTNHLLKKQPLYDESKVMEFTEGKVSHVFGSDFSEIDTYPVRLRLPSPPFMALSRVLELNAVPLSMQSGSIVTEFDIPNHAWYTVDQQVPFMTCDAQGILFLLSYVGVDFAGKGKLFYRWLNSEFQFFDEFPKAGETISYHIQLKSFVQSEDALLCFSDFECTVNGRLILKIGNTCAGFFNQTSLNQAKGLGKISDLQDNYNGCQITPILSCKRSSFSSNELQLLQQGKLSDCFGTEYDQQSKNISLRLTPSPMLMIDKISKIQLNGGTYGFGYIFAEKHLNQTDWYLRNHFKDLPIFAGPCMMQSAIDLMQFYALYIGLQTKTYDARFQMSNELYKATFRKQIAVLNGIFKLRADIKSVQFNDQPQVIADVSLIYNDEIIGLFENLGIQLKEKQTSNVINF